MITLNQIMQKWLLWAGISFVLGGAISWGMMLGVSNPVSLQEDLSGYAIGWVIFGLILICVFFIKRKNK